MTDGLTVRTIHENHRTRAVPRGALDLATAEAFADELLDVLREGRPVHIELGRLEFLDSAGIASLMKLSHAARQSLQQLTFGRGAGQVQNVLDTVRAEQFLMFVEEPAEGAG